MTSWQGQFIPTEAKGLDKLKKPTKPDTTSVKKDITKTSKAEKIPATMAENLLKKKLVDKQFDLLFAGTDPRVIYVLADLLLERDEEPFLKEAAIQAKIHLDKTYGAYVASGREKFSTVAALAPFSTGELTKRDRVAAKLYMWYLYGENKAIAYEVFKNIMDRQSGSTDLVDFMGKNDIMYNGKPLNSLLEEHNWIIEELINHSFETVERVVRSATEPIMSELISSVLQSNKNQMDITDKQKAFLILLAGNRYASSISDAFRDEFYDLQKSLAKGIFHYVDVDKTRQMYAIYDKTSYWKDLVKFLVPIERISADNLIFLVSELQRRNALSEAEEEELVDASRMLELTRTLDDSTIGQERRGFKFRGL